MKPKGKKRKPPTKPKRTGAGYVELREKGNNHPLGVYTCGGKEYATPNGMPATVKIYGQIYKVIFHSHIFNAPKKNQRLRGVVVYQFRTIVLEPRQSIHDMRETLYHEIAHVYLHDWQHRSLALSNLTPVQVEEVCDMFAEGHYDAILNNPSAG